MVAPLLSILVKFYLIKEKANEVMALLSRQEKEGF
jgi:hypothetical protein